jgi:signal transduction histidine kinase
MNLRIEPRSTTQLDRIVEWFMHWRWWVLCFLGILIIASELREHFVEFSQTSPIFFRDVFLYFAILASIAILFEFLARAVHRKTQAYNNLNLKHALVSKFSTVSDWQALTESLGEFVDTLIPATISYLIIQNQDSAQFEIFSSEKPVLDSERKNELIRGRFYCHDCSSQENSGLHSMQSCPASRVIHSEELSRGYCLPISFGNSQKAYLQLFLAPDRSLSSEQVDILNNISPDIGLALDLVQQRIALSAYLITSTVDTIRHEISRDLHDTIGQNLSYLHLKLEQFSRMNPGVEIAEIKPDLLLMLTSTSETLEVFRDILFGLQVGDQTCLENLLLEYGMFISGRANFELQFSNKGTPSSLDYPVIHQVFFVYREALNNVERHAFAKKVQVGLHWGRRNLTIRIKDDGKGFNLEGAEDNQHYGIRNMQERIEALNGSIRIASSEGTGTQMIITLPVEN